MFVVQGKLDDDLVFLLYSFKLDDDFVFFVVQCKLDDAFVCLLYRVNWTMILFVCCTG